MKIHLFLLTALLAVFMGCNKDPVVGPDVKPDIKISSGVTGTINFTGEWPAKAAEVRLVTSKVFPPEMEDIIFGDSIPADTSKYDFGFQLEPETYKFIGVAWRNEGADWNFPSICSFYFSKEDSLSPVSVTIKDNSSIVTDVNIKVDRSKARIVSDAKIKGSIKFNGNWPAEFYQARVVATTRFDLTTMDIPTLNDLAFSKSIAAGTTAYDYEIPAFPGNFKATFVIFFKKDTKLSVEDVLYSSEVGGLDIETTYTVELNSAVKGPDFTIEF